MTAAPQVEATERPVYRDFAEVVRTGVRRGLNTNNIAQVRARVAFFLQVRGLSAPIRVARFAKLAHVDNPAAILHG